MSESRPTFSLCIPSYNRARYLRPLLDSIFRQDFEDFEVVLCEDQSPERDQISAIVAEYQKIHPARIRYFENEENLGYDANIRNLVARADGRFCFFLGNDDLLAEGALRSVADLLVRYPGTGFVLKSYAWFHDPPRPGDQVVRYFAEERSWKAGRDAMLVCYRRSGVISGYVVHRDAAHAAATSEFDGTLYYQMHLTASVCATMPAVFTPNVLVQCRAGEAPDFGNSRSERGSFIPGRYTPAARLAMIGGAMTIIQAAERRTGIAIADAVRQDYANYFYPYIRDQFKLPFREYWKLYRGFSRMGFGSSPLFHVYFIAGYLLGDERFDRLSQYIKGLLGGRSPQFGKIG